MPFYYYLDPTMLIVLPALILALWAQINVKSTFSKYSKVNTRSGVTGFEAARRILDANGLYNVSIERVSGHLTDHYDPKANVIRLSSSVYSSTSAASIGVAAHEAGHAVQHAKGYAPIKLRMSIIGITNFGSMAAMPLFLIGLILASPHLMYAGIALYSLVAVFQLITLPVEFNASSRALAALDASGRFTSAELKASKKVLSAAALTYVAALASSLLSLLRLIVIANGNNRR
jgi:Zn-dependent membrane protease YugP